jgi:hypothetical protein
MKKFGLCLGILIFFCYHVNSQNKSVKNESYFKADLNYLNDLVYLGRKDSIAVPYLTATLGYYHKSGFYLSGALSYSPSSTQSRIDLFTVDAGYDYTINDIFSGSVYGEKYFYNKSSNSIKSDISGVIDGSLTADLTALQLGIDAGASFASKIDFTTTLSASHLFTLGDENNSFSINPSFNVNFSTLNFYEGLTNKKIGKKRLINNPNYLSLNSTTVASKQGFTLMDYEFSIPLEYKLDKFVFYLTPYYAIPTNPITTTTNATIVLMNGSTIKQQFDSTPWSEKNLKSLFYLEIGLNFSF